MEIAEAPIGSRALPGPMSALAQLVASATPPIIDVVNSIVSHAYDLSASDIHIDPVERHTDVRLRIDGALVDMLALPKMIHREIIARIKVLARLRADEHQRPQDGRFHFAVAPEKHIDIRVSIVPAYWGENAVLRLLANSGKDHTLQSLGFSAQDEQKISEALNRPHGMILVTGPTGSGKTTTLYTLIKMLGTRRSSIVTLEDPIEYAMEGVRQIQVEPGRGLTFGSGLRALVRQDPDIIMVGEIRDTETAALAVNTALTGHLLLSTLHTNDAATTLPRLLDMGIDAYLVASTVTMTVAQRLVRRICSDCKEEYQPSLVECENFEPSFFDNASSSIFARGKGCAACANTGFRGRIGIAEVLQVDDAVREGILRRSPHRVITEIARRGGMRTMREDGLAKAREGITTIAEILQSVIA